MNLNVDYICPLAIASVSIWGAFSYSRYRRTCRDNIARATAIDKDRQETIAKLDDVLPTMAKLLSPLASKPFEYKSCAIEDHDFIVKFARRE